MTPSASTSCSRCGAAAAGRFCASCGAALDGASCTACNRPLTPGARFCHHCGGAAGSSIGSSASGGVAAAGGSRNLVAWLVPGVALICLAAFFIGQQLSRGKSAPDTAEQNTPLGGAGLAAPFAGGAGAPSGAGAAGAASGERAPDISSLSPQERADRLFNRVMRYGEEGKIDSARIFAPMAIQAYEMAGPLDAHRRYDIGMIAVVAGDAGVARAQADTILSTSKTHLLGLVLAMKSAGLRQDAAARAEYQKRIIAAAPTERAKGLKEYEDHKSDIDAALTAPIKRP
jgi:hypothetical protein